MSEIKFTKTELRTQQVKLGQLQKYLPTLQLKKALLQIEVHQAETELLIQQKDFEALEVRQFRYASLFTDADARPLFAATALREVVTDDENIAGVDVPIFKKAVFAPKDYSLFDTPFWMDSAAETLEEYISTREKIRILKERKRRLEKELREVSIRVNLFEKILIPRTVENIKKIRIFLGDQMLAAVAQAKVSKRKILQRKEESA